MKNRHGKVIPVVDEPVHTAHRSVDDGAVGDAEFVIVRMVSDAIHMPNAGVAHVEVDARTLTRLNQVSGDSCRGGRSALLVPPRGRTGILVVPVGLDGPVAEPPAGRLTTFLLRERARFVPSPDHPGMAIIPPQAVTFEKEALSLELMVLSASIANLIDAACRVFARDELAALGDKLGDSWFPDSLLDRIADLVLSEAGERIRFLLERSPRRRIAQLTRHVVTALVDSEGSEREHPDRHSSTGSADRPPGGATVDANVHPTSQDAGRHAEGSAMDQEPEHRIGPLRDRIRAALPPSLAAIANSQLDLIEAASTDAALRRIRCIALLPWESVDRPAPDLAAFRMEMDREHLGHNSLKAHLADIVVRTGFARRRGATPSERAVLLVGPPGVGKTSLAKAFAAALGRPFAQISLAGVRDAATLVGTAQNYADSVPGRIMQAIIGTSADSVILLDEVDRMGTPGQVSGATNVLLSLLDDSDEGTFTDSFLAVPFPVGNVQWIATANDADNIPKALLDRMEIFEVPGYTDEERMAIAKDRLAPRIVEDFGLQPDEVSFTEDGISALLGRDPETPSLRGIQAEIRRALTAVIVDVEADRAPVVVDHEYISLRVSRKR